MRGPSTVSRVTIVEDHSLFAEALDVALTLEGHRVEIVGIDTAASTAQLLASISRSRPGLVLLDLDLGNAGNGVRLVGPLAEAGIAVVVVTGDRDEGRWGECLLLGARTVLSKAAPLNAILSAVRAISAGRPVMTREERDRLIAAHREEAGTRQRTRRRLETLSTREREVLAHLMAGHTVRDIATRSFVSEGTVRTQVKAILSKLGVSSQIAAVGVARQAGWQPPLEHDAR